MEVGRRLWMTTGLVAAAACFVGCDDKSSADDVGQGDSKLQDSKQSASERLAEDELARRERTKEAFRRNKTRQSRPGNTPVLNF
jgi:hypothetical protein